MTAFARTPAEQMKHERYLARKARLHAAGVTANGKPWKAEPTASERDHADRARFWSHVDKSDECWTWTAGRNRSGYGKFKIGGRTLGAHRVAFAWEHGDAAGLLACHHCDNPACVRPSHMFAGTPDDNMQDKVRKGRQSRGASHSQAVCAGERRILRGSEMSFAKLTEAVIPEIRAMHAAGGHTLGEIAARFGISRQTVLNVASRKTWRHVA